MGMCKGLWKHEGVGCVSGTFGIMCVMLCVHECVHEFAEGGCVSVWSVWI